MELIPQELRACMASMAIVDSEEGALGPVLFLPMGRLRYIQNYGNSVFIIIPNQTLVGYGRVRSYYSIPLYRALRWLLVWNDDSCSRLQSQLLRFSLFIS